MVIIQEYQSSILELIENIEHKQNQSFRDNTVLPIYKDLYYVLNWMERIPNISFLTQLEFEGYRFQLFSWYRTLMEHLCLSILMNGLGEEGFDLYIKYRVFEYHRQKLYQHKKLYDIKFEEILHIVPMCQTVKEIETLEAKHGDVLSQILKEKKDRIKLEKMNSSPFKSQEKLHQEAFKKGNHHERILLGGKNYENLYGRLSYSVHTNPLSPYLIQKPEFQDFLSENGILLGIVTSICKNTGIDFIFTEYSKDDYNTLFKKHLNIGDIISNEIVKNKAKIDEIIDADEYTLYKVILGSKLYTIPADEVYLD